MKKCKVHPPDDLKHSAKVSCQIPFQNLQLSTWSQHLSRLHLRQTQKAKDVLGDGSSFRHELPCCLSCTMTFRVCVELNSFAILKSTRDNCAKSLQLKSPKKQRRLRQFSDYVLEISRFVWLRQWGRSFVLWWKKYRVISRRSCGEDEPWAAHIGDNHQRHWPEARLHGPSSERTKGTATNSLGHCWSILCQQ